MDNICDAGMKLSCFRPVIGTVVQEDNNDTPSIIKDTVSTTGLRACEQIVFTIIYLTMG
jgi:hypothetical protein